MCLACAQYVEEIQMQEMENGWRGTLPGSWACLKGSSDVFAKQRITCSSSWIFILQKLLCLVISNLTTRFNDYRLNDWHLLLVSYLYQRLRACLPIEFVQNVRVIWGLCSERDVAMRFHAFKTRRVAHWSFRSCAPRLSTLSFWWFLNIVDSPRSLFAAFCSEHLQHCGQVATIADPLGTSANWSLLVFVYLRLGR